FISNLLESRSTAFNSGDGWWPCGGNAAKQRCDVWIQASLAASAIQKRNKDRFEKGSSSWLAVSCATGDTRHSLFFRQHHRCSRRWIRRGSRVCGSGEDV